MKLIPLSKPSITDRERDRVSDVLTSGRLALGPQLEEFEARMANVTGTKHAVAVNSGTAALHLILKAAGIRKDDEVVTTPFSFVASSNVILYCDARPVFCDIDEKTFNIAPEGIESSITGRTSAILGVDVFGLPADWRAIERLADENDLLVIDDACEALGASLNDQPVGSFGLASAFGFYPNKQVTTGEGGCVTTNSETLADTIRSLRNHGRASSEIMNHVRLGYNYRLDELSAAVGNAQLERLDEMLEQRRRAARFYSELLSGYSDDIIVPEESSLGVRSWFVYVIQLSKNYSAHDRDIVMDQLRKSGIQCAPYFPCIHLQPYYVESFGYRRGMFPVAESVSDRSIALPFFVDISQGEIERVVQGLATALAAVKAFSLPTSSAT